MKIFLEALSGKECEDRVAAMAEAAFTPLLDFFGLVRIKTVLAYLRNRFGSQAPAP